MYQLNRTTLLICGIVILALGVGVSLTLGGVDAEWLWAVDAIAWSAAMAAASFLLGGILRYILPTKQGTTYLYIVSAVGIILTATIVGIEVLTVWLSFGTVLTMIGARVFITLLVVSLTGMFFLHDDVAQTIAEPAITELAETAEIPSQSACIDRLTVRTGGKIRVLTVSEINYINADGDYCEIVATDGRWLKEQTMKWFEENLPTDKFLRIHRSTIVNLERIHRIERYGTQYHVQLHSSETLSVSAAGYKLLRERLGL